LNAIPLLRKKFKLNVAYGNHAENTNVLYIALAFEPSDLLFYVKGNKSKNHPDESHAIKLDLLDVLIPNLRNLPKALGKGVKLKMKPKIK
jgi:sialic acid synthase SpsE